MNNPLVQPDPGLFIWTLITFLVVLVILKTMVWKPLLAALDEREQRIRDALSAAEKARAESQASLDEQQPSSEKGSKHFRGFLWFHLCAQFDRHVLNGGIAHVFYHQ